MQGLCRLLECVHCPLLLQGSSDVLCRSQVWHPGQMHQENASCSFLCAPRNASKLESNERLTSKNGILCLPQAKLQCSAWTELCCKNIHPTKTCPTKQETFPRDLAKVLSRLCVIVYIHSQTWQMQNSASDFVHLHVSKQLTCWALQNDM